MEGRSHRLRSHRASVAGAFYMVTYATYRRRPLLLQPHLALEVIRDMRHRSRTEEAATRAFVVMPDHVHWIFRLGSARTLSALIKAHKNFSARQINRLRGICGGPVWQDGFFDRQIRSETELARLERYIVENPVRAGLAEAIEDYGLWDGAWNHASEFLPS